MKNKDLIVIFRVIWAIVSIGYAVFSAGTDLAGWFVYGILWWLGDYLGVKYL